MGSDMTEPASGCQARGRGARGSVRSAPLLSPLLALLKLDVQDASEPAAKLDLAGLYTQNASSLWYRSGGDGVHSS